MEWRAHVSEDYEAMVMDARRVIFHRRLGDGGEVIVGFGESGHPIVESRDPNTVSDFRGLLIPPDALEALAELLKPGPSRGEVARLEESLAVERRRVDDLLARLATPTPETR